MTKESQIEQKPDQEVRRAQIHLSPRHPRQGHTGAEFPRALRSIQPRPPERCRVCLAA